MRNSDASSEFGVRPNLQIRKSASSSSSSSSGDETDKKKHKKKKKKRTEKKDNKDKHNPRAAAKANAASASAAPRPVPAQDFRFTSAAQGESGKIETVGVVASARIPQYADVVRTLSRGPPRTDVRLGSSLVGGSFRALPTPPQP